MIESAAYDIIKQEGFKEGKIQNAREMLREVLETRFQSLPNDLGQMIEKIEDRQRIKMLVRLAVSCESLGEFKKRM